MTSTKGAFVDSEIVLGLVAPVGTEFDKFGDLLSVALSRLGYESKTVRMAQLSQPFVSDEPTAPETPEFERITRMMDRGNAARARGGPEVLALAAASQIASKRPNAGSGRGPYTRTAHVLRSLKHPAEVQALRRIYGPGFFLIGLVTSIEARRTYLEERKGLSSSEIDQLLARDERERDDHGQRTRDTFHLADAFVPLDDVKELDRLLRLIFGYPYFTPTKDEHAMFMAFAAALRSADLSRQVGAAVMSPGGEVLALGANDVPAPRGGLCWPGPDDDRDHVHGEDMNEARRRLMVDEVLDALVPTGVDRDTWRSEGRQKLKSATIMDITEYGRAVHAEMEALLACARVGVSTKEATLFTTTFPCHNCAKHILAAGIARVVYVEPYPKSQAIEMYGKSIVVEREDKPRVTFQAFRGIGPRRFFDLFSMGLSSGYEVKRKQDGRVREWKPEAAQLRVPLLPNSYIAREQAAADTLRRLFESQQEHSDEQADAQHP